MNQDPTPVRESIQSKLLDQLQHTLQSTASYGPFQLQAMMRIGKTKIIMEYCQRFCMRVIVITKNDITRYYGLVQKTRFQMHETIMFYTSTSQVPQSQWEKGIDIIIYDDIECEDHTYIPKACLERKDFKIVYLYAIELPFIENDKRVLFGYQDYLKTGLTPRLTQWPCPKTGAFKSKLNAFHKNILKQAPKKTFIVIVTKKKNLTQVQNVFPQNIYTVVFTNSFQDVNHIDLRKMQTSLVLVTEKLIESVAFPVCQYVFIANKDLTQNQRIQASFRGMTFTPWKKETFVMDADDEDVLRQYLEK